jgi:hypothetical protein
LSGKLSLDQRLRCSMMEIDLAVPLQVSQGRPHVHCKVAGHATNLEGDAVQINFELIPPPGTFALSTRGLALHRDHSCP